MTSGPGRTTPAAHSQTEAGMKPAKLVLKITMVLSLTFFVTVQPALQGQAPKPAGNLTGFRTILHWRFLEVEVEQWCAERLHAPLRKQQWSILGNNRLA